MHILQVSCHTPCTIAREHSVCRTLLVTKANHRVTLPDWPLAYGQGPNIEAKTLRLLKYLMVTIPSVCIYTSKNLYSRNLYTTDIV